MFPWLAQSELIAGLDNTILLGALALLFVFVLVVLILRRLARRRKKPVQNGKLEQRLEDVSTVPEAQPARPPQVQQEAVAPPPIEEKLRQLEAAEAAAKAAEAAAQGKQAERATETSAPAIDDATMLSFLEEDIEFEPADDLSFLLGTDIESQDVADEPAEPEVMQAPEATPAEPADVLNQIEARLYLEQLNRHRLYGLGEIRQLPDELTIVWPGTAGQRGITIQVLDAETVAINGEQFVASPEGIKAGIVASLRNDNY